MGVLQRFWSKHRLATGLCLAFLFLGLLLQPWSLVLVLAVSFGGPLLKRLESFKASPISSWRRDHWIGVALVLSVVLLALTGGISGRGALILALLPVAWVLVTDRSLLQDHKQIERGSSDEPLALSTTDGEEEDKKEPPEPLVGAELLAKVKELGDVGKSDLVRACGYFSIKEDGGERINFTGFYEALLEAKGVDMSTSTADSDDGEESQSSDEESIDLPSDWKDLESHEIVDRLRDSDEVKADVLTALASSEDWLVRQAVAWHDNTPDDVVKKLADDVDWDVSKATRDRGLPKIWRFMDQQEKIEGLKSSDISSEIIAQLARSEDWTIRQAVGWSPSTSESILEKLSSDEDEGVSKAATIERLLPLDWRFLSSWEKAERLQEEAIEIELLENLAQSWDSDVRRAVALSPSTTESILEKLKEDNDEEVSKAATTERLLPMDWRFLSSGEKVDRLQEEEAELAILEILTKTWDSDVRKAVAVNPATPENLLAILREDDDESVKFGVKQRDLPGELKIYDEDEIISWIRTAATSFQEDVLDILSYSDRWTIRQAVAQSPLASESILRAMIERDGDDDVIKAARRSLKKIIGGNEQGEDEEKSIYIKTEPGGHVLFGKLSEEQIEELKVCIGNQDLSEELREIADNSYGQLEECNGVFNSGEEGELGNEGVIVIDAEQPSIGPVFDGEAFEDGVYVVVMKLSKCSIEFEFNAKGGFDEEMFEEISIPVCIPEEIKHPLYFSDGCIGFNVISGFKFRGEVVEEYDGEVFDRGYETQLTFFYVLGGVTTIVYSDYNGEEEWHDCDDASDDLQYLQDQ